MDIEIQNRIYYNASRQGESNVHIDTLRKPQSDYSGVFF